MEQGAAKGLAIILQARVQRCQTFKVVFLRDVDLFFSFPQAEMARVTRFLKLEMGLDLKDESKNVPINFTKAEIDLYIQRFRAMDTGNKGYITVNDLRQYFKVSGPLPRT